jgi:plasmid maintenance system antidote protein VapI
MWQRYFSQVLQNSFDRAREQNPKLSLRAYARQLDVSPSVLSELLRDQRKISGKRALEIASAAQMDSSVLEQLRKNIQSKPEPSSRQLLSSEAVDLVMNPLYYRLLCALEILPTPTTLPDAAAFLDVENKDLRAIAKKLEKLEVVKLEGNQIFWQGRHITTTEDIPSKKIQAFHKDTLREAAFDLKIPVDEREYTSVTFAGCVQRLLDAKNHIRSFRDTLSDSMRDSKPNRVYQLSIQLRPVSLTLKEDMNT